MRRLLLVVVLLLLAGCVSSVGTAQHWRGAGDRTILVALDPASYDPTFAAALLTAAAAWSNTSPYVNFWVWTGDCPDPNPCVEVHRVALNGADAQWSYGGDNHILHAWVRVDSAVWDYGQLVNALCHELGHALGLLHGNVPGPCQGGAPTPVDLDNIANAYNHAD